MFTPASALLWEIRRSLRWRFWLTLFVLMLFPTLTIVVTTDHRHWNGEFIPMAAPAQMVLTITNLMLCALLIGYAIGMPSRQFTLPVSSRSLATARLLPGTLACAGLYLLLALILNVLLGAGWPYVGPAVSYGVGYMLLYSAVYRYRGNDTRMGLAGLAVAAMLIVWIASHYGPNWWKEQTTPWSDLTPTELLVLLTAGGLAWGSMADSLQRDRHGAGRGRVKFRATESVATVIKNRRPAKKFWSSVTALFWQEWRQDGWLLPSVIGGLMIIFAVVQIGSVIYFKVRGMQFQDHPTIDPNIGVTVGGTFCFVCAIAPWFLGLSGQHGKRAVSQSVWPTAQSTLPISDAAAAWVVMVRSIASALVGTGIVITISAVWTGALMLLLTTADTGPYRSPDPVWMTTTMLEISRYIAFYVLALWLATGFSTAATLSGRWWIASIPICTIPAWILALCVAGLVGHSYSDQVLIRVIYTALGSALIGTAVAYVLGIIHGIIGVRSLVIGFLVFALAEGIGMWFLDYQYRVDARIISRNFVNSLIMLCALTAAPPALLPLAAYYNRHR